LTRKPAKIFFGWWIVIASFLIAFYVAGVVQYGFTALFEPIANEMDWSYAHIALAASLRGVEMSLLAPIAGIFADRWGPIITILIGATIAAMGLSLLSRVTSLVMFYGAFALIAMGISGCTMTVLMAAVARWFRKKVGLATGIAVCGFGTSGLLIPGIVKLIDMYEWRTATNILALGMLVWILPLSFVFRHKPEQYGYLPDGAVEEPIKHMHDRNLQSASEVGMTAKQALQSGVFWRIALVYTCNVMFISTVITHIMPYLSNVGIARSLSSVVATALPLISIGGRLGLDWRCRKSQ